jgi:hypothetical protein
MEIKQARTDQLGSDGSQQKEPGRHLYILDK